MDKTPKAADMIYMQARIFSSGVRRQGVEGNGSRLTEPDPGAL